MILKSFLLEKNLSLIDNYNLILFYGENIGLKDEFKIGLKKKYYRYEQILFDQDEIIKNEKLLNDQMFQNYTKCQKWGLRRERRSGALQKFHLIIEFPFKCVA